MGTPVDAGAAYRVWDEANTARRGGESAPNDDHERVRGYLGAGSGFLVMAEEDDRAIAVAFGGQAREDDGAGPPIPGLCHVSLVMVVPDRWGEGLGGLVTERVTAEARLRGFDRVQLWTHEDNVRSRALYRRLGFTETGQRKPSETGEADIIHLAKVLDPTRWVHDHYELGVEIDRLTGPFGTVEFERTKEIVDRHLPLAPASVADIGGGPGAYSLWLAERGYSVIHRDLVPLHVEEVRARSAAAGLPVDAAVGDARDVDLPDASVDAVLLFGPLYHLLEAADRRRALAEARRILRPGGVLFAVAISRWIARLHGRVVQRMHEDDPGFSKVMDHVEDSGVLIPLKTGDFGAYSHRPQELSDEITAARFDVVDLVSVEGIAFALHDLEERLAKPAAREVLFDAARAIERVPELLGLGPHLLATARKPESSAED
jgi:SAM-dependent methyltransferase